MVIDFEEPLDEERLRSATEHFFAQVPAVRTLIKNGRRIVQDQPLLKDVIRIQEITPAYEQEFYSLPFKLDQEHPFRLLYGPLSAEAGTWRLIISVHHSSFDGIAQASLLRELLKAYEGKELSPWIREVSVFRYRNIFLKHLKPWRSLFLLGQIILNLIVRPKKKSFTLISDPSNTNRKCKVEFFEVPQETHKRWNAEAKAQKINVFELISLSTIRALNSLSDKGEKKPVVLIIPVNLRTSLRNDKYFQNVIGTGRIRFSREDIEGSTFVQLFKDRFRESTALDRMLMDVVTLGFVTVLLGKRRAAKKIRELDEDPNYIYVSCMVSAIRLPLSWDLSSFKIKRMFGHGNINKSPGLAVILTGTRENPILVLEYLEHLFKPEDIDRFKNALFSHLGLSS